ncbi:MAG: TetR/AcrR family transcriptional regulator [Gammaproteobacteria bacterium]|uniref:TetR/AcrR family transcriptional regulator n=1 Tax=Pseudomaricurvus alcaniphilus TaxID=1166482 RepID=UPI0014092F65|nr:TetR/AcrR family transcriptional regulator [Pseudomaricurvus alcaniphilus]MBR9909356.1 TetR/AcrR family transcriptional regulator [Gammaproteobacteria bacterium]NHN38292.1 TetR/AcrR family transcriptional regulator [Pseudomaricurvus alcaniphilus]
MRMTREQRREETRRLIREAAVTEFASGGVAGTSAEKIADAAGYTRGAFYANYPNKQALLLDLVQDRINGEIEVWQQLTESFEDLDQLLEVFRQRSEKFDPEGVWSMLFAESALYALRDAEFAAGYSVVRQRMCKTYEKLFQTLFRKLGLQPPVPLDEFCDALLTLFRNNRLLRKRNGVLASVPFSPQLLIQFIRGMIAISEPIK